MTTTIMPGTSTAAILAGLDHEVAELYRVYLDTAAELDMAAADFDRATAALHVSAAAYDEASRMHREWQYSEAPPTPAEGGWAPPYRRPNPDIIPAPERAVSAAASAYRAAVARYAEARGTHEGAYAAYVAAREALTAALPAARS